MPLIIRRATLADCTPVAQLIAGLSHFFTLDAQGRGAEMFLETLSPEAISRYIDDPAFCYWVALEDEQLVGVIALRDARHLFHLFVSTTHQGRGIATRLWECLAAQAAGPVVTVNSTPFAVPVYERFGFFVTGPRVETRGVAYIPMRREAGMGKTEE